MIILSFDVGIKNMAYCIVEFTNKSTKEHKILNWGIINCAEDILNNNLKCGVTRKGNLCGKDAVNKVTVSENKILGFCHLKTCQKELHNSYIKNIKNIKRKTANSIPLVDLGSTLFKELNNLDLSIHSIDIDCVVIENQPALKNPTMKSLQIILFSYFIFNKKDKKYEIKLFNASRKLQIYDGPNIDVDHIKNKYSKRKYLSIKYTEYLLDKYNNNKLVFFNSHKKKDDLADSYMQSLTYYYKN